MKSNVFLSEQEVWEYSYSNFVALINQWNVLPGAYVTLSKWKQFSNINSNSKILEIACTTGFSSRELALMTGCRGEALDLSSYAIDMANYNLKNYAPNIKVKYFCADGLTYKSEEKYTHIIVGASLKFFNEPELMVNRCIEMLDEGGYLLAAPFYIIKPIPQELLNAAKSVFGIIPTTEPYKEVVKLYKGLEIIYEDHNFIYQETEEEIEHYCSSTVERTFRIYDAQDNTIRQAIYKRLYEIKKMSNDLRPYQKYVVLVLRYRQLVFPARYVELF